MNKGSITAKIWLSIGIFVLGFLVSTAQVQRQGIEREHSLESMAEAYFPAAQAAQSAEGAFINGLQAFGDAIVIEDRMALDRGLTFLHDASEGATRIARLPGLPVGQQADARQLAARTDEYSSRAERVYRRALQSPLGIAVPAVQQEMLGLATEGNALREAFGQQRDRAAASLLNRVHESLEQSHEHRAGTLWLFVITACVAFLIVSVTIRRVVVNPILRLNAELESEQIKAKAASAVKSQFLANMSHEIRTPINGIQGMAQLLSGTNLDAEQRDYVATIHDSVGALLGLINDILDLSKIEAGKLQLESIPYDLLETVDGTVEMLAQRAEEKGLVLSAVVDADVPDRLMGDPLRLRQVLLNLVSNAVKFTDHGSVTIQLSRRGREAQDSRIRCEVRDTGIGIAPEAQHQLFRPFVQEDASTTRRFAGTGLGLSISRQLIELMRGSIGLSSEPGVGSTFWFEIPCRAVAQGADERMTVLMGRRVLIATTAPQVRLVCEQHLRRYGLATEACSSGEEALLVLQQAASSGAPFDYALLFDREGSGVGERLLAQTTLRATRLIMVGDRRPRNLGTEGLFRGALTLPVRHAQLMDVLLGCKPVTDAAVGNAAASPAESVSRVLVAEDNVVNQKVILRLLSKLGYQVELVPDGRKAVDAALHGGFDAVLMDCQMPEMDGYAATAEIRRRETGRRVPIIALTANAMKGDREGCLAAGMDDYLAKPVDLEQLSRALQRWSATGESNAPQSTLTRA